MTIKVSESEFWQKIKRGLDLPDVHMSRIESTSGPGISDISACCNSVETWLELKIFHSNRLHFRASQRIWISRRMEVGGRVLVLVLRNEEIFIYPGSIVLLNEYRVEKEGKSFSIHFDDLPTPMFTCGKPFKWQQIKGTIFGTT
jgi:hypothetical protein